jgi:4'-phosphopantetheinyl transferase
MVHVLAIRNEAQLEADRIAKLSAKLPRLYVEKAARYRRYEDQQACLLARHLILLGMSMFDTDVDLENVEISDLGRPSLPGRVDFNISHTNGLVACAFALQMQVGLDVEFLRPLPLADFDLFFSQGERELIASSADQERALIEFWTFKEAICKAAGTGILNDLPEIRSNALRRGELSISHAGKAWQVRQLDFGTDHAAAIAYESSADVSLQWVELNREGCLQAISDRVSTSS